MLVSHVFAVCLAGTCNQSQMTCSLNMTTRITPLHLLLLLLGADPSLSSNTLLSRHLLRHTEVAGVKWCTVGFPTKRQCASYCTLDSAT